MFGRFELTAAGLEAGLVFTVLALSAYFGGGTAADWLACVAVLLSFLCAQAAFDLAESNRRLADSSQRFDCRYRRLYLAKELFWIATCVVLQNYPLIASTIVFASYPFWRDALRAAFATRSEPQLAIAN